MKHSITITPLNCAFGSGINNFLRMEESEYVTAGLSRRMYCKSPDISWFKMKSNTETPFLEPAFYGLKPGDIIEVELSALLLSGVAPNITIPFTNITDVYAASPNLRTEIIASAQNLKSHYKKFKVRWVVPATFTGIGVLLNLRPSQTVSEIIIKDIIVTIDTVNPLFSIVDNITAFRTKTDYMQCVDYITGSNLNAPWNGLKTVHTAGEVLFPDDYTMQFSGADVSNFKGLATCFNGAKYRRSIAVYAEYSITTANPIVVSAYGVSDSSAVASVGGTEFSASAVVRKSLMFVNVTVSTPSRKTLIDLGRTGVNNFTLKNVRISMPQFDDGVKREPNQLSELYTNLSAKLR